MSITFLHVFSHSKFSINLSYALLIASFLYSLLFTHLLNAFSIVFSLILSNIILDSLNPIIDIYYTSLIALTDKNVQISIESNIKCLTFLKDVETLNIVFEKTEI